jgi:ABC-type transport system substrate-binding protein
MAIDKQAIVDAVYGGGASVADTLVPPSMWAHDDAPPTPASTPRSRSGCSRKPASAI